MLNVQGVCTVSESIHNYCRPLSVFAECNTPTPRLDDRRDGESGPILNPVRRGGFDFIRTALPMCLWLTASADQQHRSMRARCYWICCRQAASSKNDIENVPAFDEQRPAHVAISQSCEPKLARPPPSSCSYLWWLKAYSYMKKTKSMRATP